MPGPLKAQAVRVEQHLVDDEVGDGTTATALAPAGRDLAELAAARPEPPVRPVPPVPPAMDVPRGPDPAGVAPLPLAIPSLVPDGADGRPLLLPRTAPAADPWAEPTRRPLAASLAALAAAVAAEGEAAAQGEAAIEPAPEPPPAPEPTPVALQPMEPPGWLTDRLDELARLERRNAENVTRLIEDNRRLRDGEVVQALHPLLLGLALLSDRMQDLGGGDAALLRVQLLQVLDGVGVTAFEPAAGAAFDPTHHRAAGVVPPTEVAPAGTVARTARPGWQTAQGGVLRVAEVEVSRLPPAGSGTGREVE